MLETDEEQGKHKSPETRNHGEGRGGIQVEFYVAEVKIKRCERKMRRKKLKEGPPSRFIYIQREGGGVVLQHRDRYAQFT